MVILQFNKLIRNKWLWGVFAVVVGGAFAFDFLIDDLMRNDRAEVRGSGAGKLAGETVAADVFQAIAEDVRGIGKGRDWKRPTDQVNRVAWETLAAMLVADRNGIAATDREVQSAIRNDRSFQVNGAFSFKAYQYLLRENGVTPERFEAFLKRRLTASRLASEMLESAAWVSPAEIDRAVADVTDSFTVRIARFTQKKEDADKVTLDAAGLKKWYEANTNDLALADRVKIRYVKFSANDPKLLAAVTVSEDEMRDQYDATIDKYTSTDTNGVEKVQPFDEVKGAIERDLKVIAAVQALETNLSFRAYAASDKQGVSRVDEIAKEAGLAVETSGWFATDGSYADGFDVRASSVCPGAENFLDTVAQLDPESEDLRYGVVLAKDAAWLIERADFSKAHVPTFAESVEIIRPRALKAAKEDAFKAEVEAIAKQGAAAVVKTANVSTNITFSVAGLEAGAFDNQYVVASVVRKLAKGEVSEFARTGADTALLVVCEDRVEGDAAKAVLMKQQIRQQLQMLQARTLPEAWQKWNLERLGFEPEDFASVTPAETSEDDE